MGWGFLLEMGSLAMLILASTGNQLLSDSSDLSLPVPRCATRDELRTEPSVPCLPVLTPPWCGAIKFPSWDGTPFPFGSVSLLLGLLLVLGLLDPS